MITLKYIQNICHTIEYISQLTFMKLAHSYNLKGQ